MRSAYPVIVPTVALAFALLPAAPAFAVPTTVQVTITNLAPTDGTNLTPLWVGFHDGAFDLYDRGESIQTPEFAGFETLVEDGITAEISRRFAAEQPGGVDATLFGPVVPPIRPGESSSFVFTLESTDPATQFFSYASMVIPSNDAFVANGNPLAFDIFDDDGDFLGANFIVLGEDVLDGGTEINDEIPENTAALAQATPNTGVDENGVVDEHPGFLDGGNVLAAIPNGDFTVPGYEVARIIVTQVPEPGTLALALGLFAGLGVLARRTR